LERFARRGVAEAIQALEGPEFPDALGYLWEWFLELDACRIIGMSGPQPITYMDVLSWSWLTERDIEPHEARAVLELDRAMRNPEQETMEE
jgi:hypothetical protein